MPRRLGAPESIAWARAADEAGYFWYPVHEGKRAGR